MEWAFNQVGEQKAFLKEKVWQKTNEDSLHQQALSNQYH
jgi:hypothetical protein